MMTIFDITLVGLLVGLPLVGVLAIGVPSVAGRDLAETTVERVVNFVGFGGLLAALALFVRVVWAGAATVDIGQWYGDVEYSLHIAVSLDPASAVATTAVAAFGWLAFRFSFAYLHREPCYARFFGASLLAVACLQTIALAASLDILFVGWELLGLCSFLLIAIFHEREETVERALRAMFNYRFTDLGLLFALMLLHGAGSSSAIGLGAAKAPTATSVGLLLLMTAAGKSGLTPFTGWLARCTEGPTSSTALFYGGLSVSAGPWLLLRTWPLYSDSLVARGALVAVGSLTAGLSTLAARSRSDVKGAVVLAGGAQIGIITAEIGLGLHTLALVHLIGNLGLRSWQLYRAPSIIHLAHQRERQAAAPLPAARTIPMRLWLVATAGGLESVTVWLVGRLMAMAHGLDRVSRRVEHFIAGDEDPR